MSNDPTPALEGNWAPLHARLRGEAAPALVLRQTRLEIAGDHYRVTFNGAVVEEGKWEATAGLPQNVVFKSLAGPQAGRSLPAMVQQVGQRLRLCYGLDGHVPNSFSAEAGEDRYLVTYRREE